MSLYKGDKSAAFIGLIAGSIVLFALVYLVVAITNTAFEGHGAEQPHAAAPEAPAAEAAGPVDSPAGVTGNIPANTTAPESIPPRDSAPGPPP